MCGGCGGTWSVSLYGFGCGLGVEGKKGFGVQFGRWWDIKRAIV